MNTNDYANGFSAGASWAGPSRRERARRTQLALCTCPFCHLVWEHYATDNAQSDLQAVRERLGNPHHSWTCPGCGGQSTVDRYQTHRVAVQPVSERSR